MPVVTYVLIAANVVIFLWQQLVGDFALVRFALFPFEVTGAEPAPGPRQVLQIAALAREYNLEPAWATIFTSMFLHGSWMHLIGNMVFLGVFGNNIEDTLGKARYLVFYLACGVVAAGAHILTAMGSIVPTVGASGAIAGVLGAYYVLFPRARVTCLIPIFIFIQLIDLPAGLVVGCWCGFPFIRAMLGWGVWRDDGGGGPAPAAHIAGFAAGYLRSKILVPPKPPRPRYYPPGPDQFGSR